jgi:cytochrome P450
MTLQLQLSPELEQRLREQARLQGTAVEQYILNAVHEKLRASEPVQVLEGDAWFEAFEQFVGSRVRRDDVHMDDSRESIYDGRGE